MIGRFSSPARLRYISAAAYCTLLVSINLLSGAVGLTQGSQQLEPGKSIETELTGGQHHYYQMTLAAGQYVKVVVDQRGIDLIVKLFAPDGKVIGFFETELKIQGSETVMWVAEVAGSYRLDISARQKKGVTGRYEVNVEELRTATDDDRIISEANKLYAEMLKLG